MQLKKFLPKLIFPALLLILVGVLMYQNYVPGTYLSGWDNLHPEFNFWLYLKRAFFGAWQEHQGIGAPAAQAAASELTRLPFVYLLTLILPENLVRYSFFFLMLYAGALGTYFLSRNFLPEKAKYAGSASFLAGMFYVLNLATLQQFYDPLEMFAVHFAALPWLILIASKYIKLGKKKDLIWFSAITLLASSQAHTATLFYAYLGAFILFVLTVAILNWNKNFLKRGIILLLLTVGLNLFWLGPNIYYVVSESKTVENSKISRTFSDEAYLQSRAFGNIESLVTLKNFPFNWREYNYSSQSFEDLMRVWDVHLAEPAVSEIGIAAFFLSLLGIAVVVWQRSKFALSLIPVMGVGIFFWLVGMPKDISLIREALRFPFTKFSILIVMSLSVFFAFWSQFILSILGKIKLSFLYFVVVVIGLIYFMLPAFTGAFIDPAMKVAIPSEYFQAFNWFGHADPSGRVAKLPIQTFWDWNYYSWGYQGGGFTWFGIPQPTMDREFDRWGAYNEDFFFQASNSLYGNDPAGFFLALKKYQIKYLLLDESLMNAGGSPDLLYIPQIKKLLENSPDIKVVAKFGFLTIYQTDFADINLFVSIPTTQIDNVQTPLTPGSMIASVNLSVNHGFDTAFNCDIKKIGTVSKSITKNGIDYKADFGGVACDYINFANMKYTGAYIIHVTGDNITGRSLKVYLTNWATGRADIEELLPNGHFDKYFQIYPTNITGGGYSLNFETRSYGPVASENIVTGVEIYSAEATPVKGEIQYGNGLSVANVKKSGSWLYEVKTMGQGTLMLGQGFEKGWVAISGSKILPHFIFDGWANAWTVNSANTVYLIYWPQIMEWAGIAIAGLIFVIIIIRI